MNKFPPIEKIYEAYTAVVDNRVIMENNTAKVFSSDKNKEYTVTWNNDIYSSNDNGSYWQGYAGYPVIAVFMLQGRLSFTLSVAELFKNINWTELNTKYKNKYSKAVDEIIDKLEDSGIDSDVIKKEVNKVYKELKALDVKYKRSSLRPPKSK